MPHGTRWNTKKGLKPLLHQEDAIAHISRCMEQVKGKKKTTPLGHGPYQHPMFKIEEKLSVNTHIIYIYIPNRQMERKGAYLILPRLNGRILLQITL